MRYSGYQIAFFLIGKSLIMHIPTVYDITVHTRCAIVSAIVAATCLQRTVAFVVILIKQVVTQNTN